MITGRSREASTPTRQPSKKRLRTFGDTIAQAEAMKNEPLTDDEIKSRLDQLKKGIPPVTERTLTTINSALFVEKPYNCYQVLHPRERYN